MPRNTAICISRAEHLLKHNINRWGYTNPTKEGDV